jgi:O-antigen/teichoic acid export membrane protein
MQKRLSSELARRFHSVEAVGVLARGSGAALFVQTAGIGIAYVGQILLARWLGVVDYGVYAYFYSWIQVFAAVALLGMDLGVVRFIPEYIIRQDWRHLRGILRWSRRLAFLAGCVLACVSAAVLFVFKPVHSSTGTLLTGSLIIPLFTMVALQTEIVRSVKRVFLSYGIPLLLLPLLILLVAFAFLYLLGNLTDSLAVAAMGISLCIVVPIQWIVIDRLFSGYTRGVPAAYTGTAWLKVSLPLLFNSLFAVLLLRIDTLAVGMILGPEEVGVYSAAVRTATIIGITLAAANIIVAPMIASYNAAQDAKGLQEVVSLATMGSFALSLLLGVGLTVFNGPLLRSFGPEFIQARFPLLILIAGQLVNVGSGSVGLLMILTGHEKQSMIVLGGCAVLVGALCLLVIPVFGIIGAAVVAMLGNSLWNLWMYRLVVKHLGIYPSIFYAVRRTFLPRIET